MNLLFLYPEFPTTFWSFKHALKFEGKRSAFPPLGLITIAPLFPAGWKRRLVDLNVESLRDRDLKWADVALVSGMLVQQKSMEELVRRCRRHGVPVVVGGPITSGVDFSHIADAVVRGEAEDLIEQLADDLQTKRLKPLYTHPERPSLPRSPLPDLSLLRLKKYSAMALQYSRGCPFNCEFCDIIEIYGRKPRTKTPAQVVTELESLLRFGWRGSVFIVDDNFIGNKRNVKQLLPVIADWNQRNHHPFYFLTEASLNLAEDEELLRQMRRANFTKVFLGIETPVEASLRETQKYQNTGKDLLESVRLIQSYGLEVMGGFIVGFDNDPPTVFEEQVRFHPRERHPCRHGRAAHGAAQHPALPPSPARGPAADAEQRQQRGHRLHAELRPPDECRDAGGGLQEHPQGHLQSRRILPPGITIPGTQRTERCPDGSQPFRLPRLWHLLAASGRARQFADGLLALPDERRAPPPSRFWDRGGPGHQGLSPQPDH